MTWAVCHAVKSNACSLRIMGDEQVIEEHNKLVESLRQKNQIVEPPPESELLLRLAKLYRFS
jgi:hypothetical protein